MVRGKRSTCTTERDESAPPRRPDLIGRAWSTSTRPDQWWVADFTYVWTLEGFCYPALCVDVMMPTVADRPHPAAVESFAAS